MPAATFAATRKEIYHRGAVGILRDGEELVGPSIVVCSQQHCILCWVVAYSPEAAV